MRPSFTQLFTVHLPCTFNCLPIHDQRSSIKDTNSSVQAILRASLYSTLTPNSRSYIWHVFYYKIKKWSKYIFYVYYIWLNLSSNYISHLYLIDTSISDFTDVPWLMLSIEFLGLSNLQLGNHWCPILYDLFKAIRPVDLVPSWKTAVSAHAKSAEIAFLTYYLVLSPAWYLSRNRVATYSMCRICKIPVALLVLKTLLKSRCLFIFVP